MKDDFDKKTLADDADATGLTARVNRTPVAAAPVHPKARAAHVQAQPRGFDASFARMIDELPPKTQTRRKPEATPAVYEVTYAKRDDETRRQVDQLIENGTLVRNLHVNGNVSLYGTNTRNAVLYVDGNGDGRINSGKDAAISLRDGTVRLGNESKPFATLDPVELAELRGNANAVFGGDRTAMSELGAMSRHAAAENQPKGGRGSGR
jgi:hypothetical protein